jgi:two-component system, OmpR family, catabolic regulation response regulator CreB
MSQARVLVVDDEPSIVDNIVYALESEGIGHATASTLTDARLRLAEGSFDVLVLDVSLPDGNGFDFCKEVRRENDIPIIFVTARSDEIDRVVGLEIGGDDYVVKPFSPRELTARIKVILRRMNRQPKLDVAEPESIRSIGVFSIDDWRKQISCRSSSLSLSLYEYRILKAFIESPGRVFSRDQLMFAAWDDPGSSVDRAVDTHVKNIRKKLKIFFPEIEVIATHRGLGYSFAECLS